MVFNLIIECTPRGFNTLQFEEPIGYDYGLEYVQSLDEDDEELLMSLSKDGDCHVLEWMGEGCGSIQPRWKKTKITRKEETCKPMVETPHLNIMLSM
jgi:hypothetical protein